MRANITIFRTRHTTTSTWINTGVINIHRNIGIVLVASLQCTCVELRCLPVSPVDRSTSPASKCIESPLESLPDEPFFDLFIEVPLDPNAHGHLVDLCDAFKASDLFQVLLYVTVKCPDVPFYLAHKGRLAVAVGDIRVDGNIVHSRPTDHVGQRRRHVRRSDPPGRSRAVVSRRRGDPRRWDQPLHKLVFVGRFLYHVSFLLRDGDAQRL